MSVWLSTSEFVSVCVGYAHVCEASDTPPLMSLHISMYTYTVHVWYAPYVPPYMNGWVYVTYSCVLLYRFLIHSCFYDSGFLTEGG